MRPRSSWTGRQSAEFSARGAIGGRAMAADRSFLERAVSFREREHRSDADLPQARLTRVAEVAAAGARWAPGIRGPSGTVLCIHSMMKLPKRYGRNFDERVGSTPSAWSISKRTNTGQSGKRVVTRLRPEKKDPNAAVSEPEADRFTSTSRRRRSGCRL